MRELRGEITSLEPEMTEVKEFAKEVSTSREKTSALESRVDASSTKRLFC